jgi:YbgC/YbaW family acyl-CoA thioester hydrolase
MIFRTLLIFLRRRWLSRKTMGEVTTIEMRVLPSDLDLLMHVNNGVYFSFMDFGRWDMIFRNGVYNTSMKNGWYSVVAGETIRFRRSLKLWEKFSLETKVLGHDEKNFFIRQRFYRKDELVAAALVRVAFLKRAGGKVSPSEVLTELKAELPRISESVPQNWSGLEENYVPV